MLAGRAKPTRPPTPRDPVQQLRAAVNAADWPRATDWAVRIGAKSREFLPSELVSGLDVVQAAFRHYESGQDESARVSLGQIGLSSPFLEWKLLLRGLMAYVGGEDGLALDNWRRLNADRLPAKLAAPLRATLDANYRASQPLGRQQALQSAADKLRGGHVAALRTLQAKLGRPVLLATALEHLARLLPRLRRESPELQPKLAQACYAAATHGHPDGAAMLKPLFEPPADDPTWSRLQALAADIRGEWLEANRHWQHYQSVLSEHIGFAGDDRDRARAMIWVHCALNARQQVLDEPRGPKPSPDAEGCYRRAIQLHPGFVEASAGLFDLYCETKRTQEAIVVGRRLLELAADLPRIHRKLAELARADKNLDLAIEHFDRARQANPFDRTLGNFTAQSRRQRARSKAMAGDLAGAEADLNAVETPAERVPTMLLKCQQAALANKRGDNDRGNQWADEARALSAAGAAWALLAEATHLKLPRPIRSTFEGAFQNVLFGKPLAGAAADLADVAIDQNADSKGYRGYKTHARKVKDFAGYTISYSAPAADFQRLCERLQQLGWLKQLNSVALHAHFQFPREPAFHYFQARAALDDPKDRHFGRIEKNLREARKLAESRMCMDPSMREWVDRIAAAERQCDEEFPTSRWPKFLEFLNA